MEKRSDLSERGHEADRAEEGQLLPAVKKI